MATPIQHRIYEFVRQYIDQHGYSPSLVEIARGIGISSKSISLISRNIHALVNAGQLKFHKKGYRSIQLADSQESSLPFIGRIAAGVPIEAIEDKQTISLCEFFSKENHFVLEVKGNSMEEEGILDGDFVICKQANRACEGDIVVALVDEQEATLKRLSYKITDRITLIPANSTLKPKAYLPHRVQIQGVLAGLLRLKKQS